MKKIVILIFLCGFFGFSQDLPEIVPPSPTAAALGEYGNVPISLAIGTPTINIPIWEVKGKQLNVPISLSYRSSGIRVDEHGSNIGIGWTLNAGGMITRTVKDKEDLAADSPRRTPWPLDPNIWYFGTGTDLRGALDNAVSFYDKEADLYYYNFLGYSGQFIFDDVGNPLVSPDVNFKMNAGVPSKITDANGIIYTFNVYEIDSDSGYVTAWYLTKIESPDLSEWISFEYTAEVTSYLVNKREARLVGYNTISTLISEPWYKTSVNNSYRLTKITSSFGETVDFNAGAVRQDLYGNNTNKPKTIADIEVKYDGTCIKKIDFDHEFIESQTPGYIDTWWASNLNVDTDWAKKRLYLKSIKETTCADSEVKTYYFDYYGRTTANKDQLPSKISFAVDHWGYFNGETSNTTYRPPFAGNIPDVNGSLHYNSISGADRTPSFPEMQYGTLKSITYPTGGQTEFVFEQHQNITAPSLPAQAGGFDSNAGGLRIKEINDKVNNVTVKSKKYTYSFGYYADYPNYGGDNLVYRTEFDANDTDVLHHFKHPTFDFSAGGQTLGTDERQYYCISSGHPNILGTTNGYHLSYGLVTETETGNGRIEHSFTSTSSYVDQENLTIDFAKTFADTQTGQSTVQHTSSYTAQTFDWPYSVRTSRSWKRGLPVLKKYYLEGGVTPIKSIHYQYEFRKLEGVKRKFRLNASNELEDYLDYANPSPMYGLKIATTAFHDEENHTGGVYNVPEYSWYLNTYEIGIGVALVAKETITENDVTTIKDYTYNDENQLATTTFTNSKSETIVSENKYPQDFAASNNVYSEMVDANVLNPVIESETKNGTNTLSVLKNNFYDWGTNLFAPQTVQVSKGTNALDNRIQFHDYYSNGNVKEVSKQDGPHIYYVWGYNEQYPIAKLENFESSQITTTVQNLINAAVTASDNDDSVSDENTLRTALSNLRNTSALSEAMVTTYTYDPLVGVTSITDPRGYTVYYEYDEFNRLEFVKDADNNLVSENKYNYKN